MDVVEQNGSESDGVARAPLMLVTESLDLPALDFSSMASLALTTDGGGASTGLYDATSEGLSMATEDKDALSSWKHREEENDDEEEAGGEEWMRQSDLKDEAKPGQDEAATSRDAEREEEDEVDQDGTKAEEDDEDDQADKKLEPHWDNVEKASGRPSPSDVKPSSFASSLRGSASDDGMAVECTSPRDLTELDEVGERDRHSVVDPDRTQHQESKSDENNHVVVHPLPVPLSVAETEGVKSVVKTSYSVKSLFPVVYEAPCAIEKSSPPMPLVLDKSAGVDKRQPPPAPIELSKETSNSSARTRPFKSRTESQTRDVAEKMQSLRAEVEALKDQLQSANKGLNLQLQVAQTERNQLAQRNTRLKAQLITLTTDLTRTKTEAAKLKMENELYAAKLPKLQAELCEETSQADEKHAATIQSQVEVSQLRAKVQVLQTRSVNLDGQVEKLQQELRLAKKELRRRVILQQQQEEKLKKLETELHESKASYAQEMMHAKNKLATSIQRLEHERVKNEAEMAKKHKKEMEEVKDVAAKALRRRKEIEQLKNNAEQQLAILKKRVEDHDEDMNDHTRQRRELETAIVRAERTETALRSQVCSLKAQLQSVEMEKKKSQRSTSHRAPTMSQYRSPSRVRKPSGSPALRERPSIQMERNSSQFPQANPTLCDCCLAIISSEKRLDEVDALELIDDSSELGTTDEDDQHSSTCTRCPELELQIDRVHGELLQLRTLHASELKVQATAFERAISMVRGTVSIH